MSPSTRNYRCHAPLPSANDPNRSTRLEQFARKFQVPGNGPRNLWAARQVPWWRTLMARRPSENIERADRLQAFDPFKNLQSAYVFWTILINCNPTNYVFGDNGTMP